MSAAQPGLSDRAERTPKLSPADVRQLCRDLATGEASRAALARRYGVVRSYVTQFARQHEREIAAIRDKIDSEFAGLWVASKEARIAAYQADYEASLAGEYAGHYEQIRTRAAILRNVAEELGSLPNRASAAIIVPVTHTLVGVDLEALK